MNMRDLFRKYMPFGSVFAKAPNEPRRTGGYQLRPNDGQGPFTPYFRNFVPRKVESTFYEFLREAIPIMDAAIRRLISLDGHVVVKGYKDNLVDEIQDWIDHVPVNDIQSGLQAYHQSLTNEAFEQGFGLGEFVPDKKRRDIIGLRVADSKFIKFKRRRAGGIDIFQKADGDLDYTQLNPSSLMYFSIDAENQNPYGTPLFRSCEFVAQILATMHNSLLNVWERFGDPSFSIIYKTSKRDGADHATRRNQIETEFNTAIRAKRAGQSADFVRAIDKDSDIDISIIGADGQVLELDVPARHVLEQIVSKTGLPPWMLGLHWSTTERLSNAEAEMLLADVATRQKAKMPQFEKLVKTMLLLRGRTWKKGDWWLEWGQVNLHDVVQQAQARFLNAQADMYYLQNADAAGITIDVNDLAIGKKSVLSAEGQKRLQTQKKSLKRSGTKETREEPWPEVDEQEDGYTNSLQAGWGSLLDRVYGILGFGVPKHAKAPEDPDVFTFSPEQRAQVLAAMRDFIGIYQPDDPDSPLRWYYGQAYSAGLIRAAQLIGQDRPILDIIKNKEVFDTLCKQGFDLVKNNATKTIQNRILAEMEAYAITGSNPNEVARRLEKLFGDKNSDWERLARSEMIMAAEQAKIDEWRAWDVELVEYAPAPDACDLCQALRGEYAIDEVPRPVRDTHPYCRCSVRPAADEIDKDREPEGRGQFVAASTVREAAKWAVANDLADMSSYKGASVEVANEWNRGVYEHVQQFPELRKNFKFIGTTQERQRKYVELRLAELKQRHPNMPDASLRRMAKREAGKTPSNWFAYSIRDRHTSGVSVNSAWGKDPDKFMDALQRSVRTGFHPVGCDTVKSVIDHEIGHQLDGLLGIRDSSALQEIITEAVRDGRSISSGLSEYAMKDKAEFIAEGWAEYRNNPEPRILAKKIGELIEKQYSLQYGEKS
jgi:SPP1 gp7 family putative phage head morphogenesis protein